MTADNERVQALIDDLTEEIHQRGYTGYSEERLDGDDRMLEFHLVDPDGTELDRPVSILLPKR